MAYIPLSQQQQRLGQQRLAVAPTRMQTPVPLQRDMMVRSPIRSGVKELYRDPYEQGNLPLPEDPNLSYAGGSRDFDESAPARISYEITGQRPPPELGVEPPAPTPQTPTLNQDPSTLKLPDLSTMSTTDFSWLDNILQTVGGTVADYFKNPMAYPAIATAWQQYKNSEQYGADREQYSKEGNPYGPYRERAAQRLEALYNDPSAIENTPGYKFRLSQGMGNLSGKQAAAHQGWGNEFGAMQNYAQGLASTEYGNEVERLMKQAGVNIGPEASLNAQTTARGQQLQSELGALQALTTPFGQNAGDARQNGGGSTGGFKASDLVNGILKNGSDWGTTAAQAIFAGGAGAAKYLADAIDKGIKYISLPDGSMIDVQAAARAGGGTIGPGGYPGYPTDPEDPRMDIPTPDELEDPTMPEIPVDSHAPFDPFDPGQYGPSFDGFFDP